jgi:hypothetical protein
VADPSDKVRREQRARHFPRASPDINSQRDRRVIFRFGDIG